MDEGRRWLTKTLRHHPGPSLARVMALTGAGGWLTFSRTRMPREGFLVEGLALARECGDVWSTAWALHLLGRVA